jgi:Tfp pilus assembly protein PilF
MPTTRFWPSIALLLPIFLLLLLAGCKDADEKKEIHFQKALVYLNDNQEREAIIELRNAIQIDPRFADARYQLGLVYLKTGEVRQAFEELQRAASLDPANLDAKIKTAEFLLLNQNKADARQHIEEVLQQSPDNKDALAMLANLEMVDGAFDAALDAIDKALAVSPNEDRLWTIKGRILSMQQQYAEAEAALLKAVELDSTKMSNHATLASFYTERKEIAKARAALENMAAVFPGSPQPFLQMVSLSLAENDQEGAEAHLGQALKVDPTNSQLKTQAAD